MRWFNYPSQDQVAFLNKHVGRRIIEPFCGPEPLFDLCEDVAWAIGVDKDSFNHLAHVRDRKDIHRSLIQPWIKAHPEEWSSSDTVIMCYPSNSDMGKADVKVLHAMHVGQRLILAVPRPWGNYTVAGTMDFWSYLFGHFWLYDTSESSGASMDTIYVLGRERIGDAKPARDLLEGHELFDLR